LSPALASSCRRLRRWQESAQRLSVLVGVFPDRHPFRCFFNQSIHHHRMAAAGVFVKKRMRAILLFWFFCCGCHCIPVGAPPPPSARPPKRDERCPFTGTGAPDWRCHGIQRRAWVRYCAPLAVPHLQCHFVQESLHKQDGWGAIHAPKTVRLSLALPATGRGDKFQFKTRRKSDRYKPRELIYTTLAYVTYDKLSCGQARAMAGRRAPKNFKKIESRARGVRTRTCIFETSFESQKFGERET
jgi:hypothetical protein